MTKGVDTSTFAKKSNLNNSKPEVDKLYVSSIRNRVNKTF